MAADKTAQWHEARRQILLALDLPAEFEALGLELANGATPNAKGWIEAHSPGVVDRNPSAGVNCEDGPALGLLYDFRDPGNAVGFFDFAMRRKGCTFGEVLKHYAEKTKVKLPGDPDKRSLDSLVLSDAPGLPNSVLLLYPPAKPGYTARALQEIGGRRASWPRGLPPEKINWLVAFPMFGTSALHGLAPTGWHCISDNPKLKIRKFRGAGNEEQLLDKMTVGEFGFMNVDGLLRLADAEVVNIVEGISDLAAVQGKLGPWRDEATEADPRRHVVLSTGGCKNNPKPEWMQHFAGKEIRIWPHMGDAKNEGENAAAVWAALFISHVKAVRVVKLPLPEEGKIDVRDWLTEEIGSPGEDGQPTCRTYADLDAYAQTFEPIDPGNEADQLLSPGDALLKSLGLVVIGEHEGTLKVEVYGTKIKRPGTIYDLNKLSSTNLIQYAGPEVEEHVHDGNEPQPEKAQMKDVRKAIAAAACGKVFHSEEKFGSGVWYGEAKDELLLVKAGAIGVVKDGKITESEMPFVGGRIFDISQSSGNWCNFDTLSRYLVESQRDRWCQDTFEEADSLFGKWFWKQKPAPRIVASMVICSFLQTLWHWRPEMFITGSSDTGKSALIGETIPQLFGKLGLYVQKPTEAAIRQHIKHHGKVILIDEFEHDKHRQAVLELFRTSSRGGKTIRGTADQKGLTFQLRHIPWLAAIETGLRRQPDKNRYIILDLNEIPAGVRGSIDIPTDDRLADLGQRLLAIGLRHFWRARELANDLKRVQIEGAPGRAVETFAVPCAMFSAIFGHPTFEAIANQKFWMKAWDFTDQAGRDDENILAEILTGEVIMDGGRRTTVAHLLDDALNADSKSALARVGLAKVGKRKGEHKGDMMLFVYPPVVRKMLLSRGEYQGQLIEQYLKRLPGAESGVRHRLGGNHWHTGLEIPLDTIQAVFARREDEDSQDEQTEKDSSAGQF